MRKHTEAGASIELAKKRIAALEHRRLLLGQEIEALGGFPKRRPRLIPFRANGEMQRALFDLLREKGEATAADLAARMLAHYGLDADDKAVAYAMRQRCIQAFKRCERNGAVRHAVGATKGGRFTPWELTIRPVS